MITITIRRFISFSILTTAILLSSVSYVTPESIEQCSIRSNGSAGNGGVNSCSSVPTDVVKEVFLTAEENFKKEGLLAETGLEFIKDDMKLEFTDKEKDSLMFSLTAPSAKDAVRMFIRKVKGIRPHEPNDGGIGSGFKKSNHKSNWVFQPYRLGVLVEIELGIYHYLQKYYKQNPNVKKTFPALESYFKDIEESTLRVLSLANTNASSPNQKSVSLLYKDPHLYVATHPLLIYRMMRRFVEDLQPILFKLVYAWDGYDLIENLYENANPNSEVFPDAQDLQDARDAISRIQRFGNLKSSEFARGKFEDVDTGFGVNALEALEIGMFFVDVEKKFDIGLEWIHLATESILHSPTVDKYSFVKDFFVHCLKYAIEKHNSNWVDNFGELWNPAVFNTKVKFPFEPSNYVRMLEIRASGAVRLKHETEWNWATPTNFIKTCSGQNLQTEQEKAVLKCWYERSIHPYWYINPLKAELLNKEPPLYQFYEFIQDKLIDTIQLETMTLLQRSTVVDNENPTNSVVQPTRTSTQTWVYDQRFAGKFMKPLTRKFEFLAGLNIGSAEEDADAYQVALYGPSHHYEAHIDSFEDPRRTVEKGNRITTIMGYLNNVEVGGRTGFPVMGVSANPVKGAVVMWNNLEDDMEARDKRTWHGGCPVVLGMKWITNKWVYSRNNMFKRKCPARH